MAIDFSKTATEEGVENKNDSDDDKIRSFDEAAKYCGVSKRTIHYHITKGTISQFPDGTFDKDSLNEYLKQKKEKQGVRSKGLREKLDNAELRLKEHKIRKEKIQADIMEGKYMSVEEIEKAWNGRIQIVKSGLYAWINRLPPILAGKSRLEVREILKTEVREILSNFSIKGKYTPTKN